MVNLRSNSTVGNQCDDKPIGSETFKKPAPVSSDRKKNVQAKKENSTESKKVNKTKVKSVVVQENGVVASEDENQTDVPNQQSNVKKLSPTRKLCRNFSDLSVGDGKGTRTDSKKKQNTNDLKSGVKKSVRLIKSKSESDLSNHKITEYFQVRKSQRKETKELYDAQVRDLENRILQKVKDGLEITVFKDKGRGIVTTKIFIKGDFVIEYIGDLIDGPTAKQNELKYAKNKKLGCYMYYFRYKDVQWCVDATQESGELGRLINHSKKGNLISKIIEIENKPHIIFFAKVDIPVGTELLYDYGDRSLQSLKYHPWLAL